MSKNVTNPNPVGPQGEGPRLGRPTPIAEQNWPEGTIPVVSICCTSYNQEAFIRDCLDGILVQETDFPVEILIHDDASTDGTASIIREYQVRCPHLFKPIYQTENQYKTGKEPNISFNFPRAGGKYIALCEGDDYWTDPTKLQRQTDFLIANPGYVLLAENAIWHDVSTDRRRSFSDLRERDLGIFEMLLNRQFATASVLFANLGSRLQIEGAFGDTILWCHLAKHGKVRYREDVSSVYRRHAGGITGSNKVEWAKRMIEWNKTLKRNHPQIDGSVFKKRNNENFKAAIDSLLEAQQYKRALLAVDELADLTDHPSAYKDELLTLIQEHLKRKDRQSEQFQTGWAYQKGRPVAMPARGALKLFW